jgi:nucleoside-diphosphate-sugar epimerase
MTTTLITGATGYLARHILDQLAARPGHSTIALVRDRKAWHDLAHRPTSTEALVGAVEADPAPLATVLAPRGVTAILHLAGVVRHTRIGTDDMLRTNVEGTQQMVRLAARLGARLVLASTSGAVGCYRHPDILADEDAPYAHDTAGRWPYYASKIAAEQAARALADKLGVTLSIVRPPMLLGPGDHRFRSTGHVSRALLGQLPMLAAGGVAVADVRDVAGAFVTIAGLVRPRPVYHTPGTNTSIAGFYRLVTELSGARPPALVPGAPLRLAAKLSQDLARAVGRPRSWLPDPVHIEMSEHFWGLRSLHADELGYRPRPLRQTLVDTIAWLRDHHPDLRARAA